VPQNIVVIHWILITPFSLNICFPEYVHNIHIFCSDQVLD